MNRIGPAVCLLVCLALPATAAATPITYTGTHAVGTGTVNLSVTTDGTIGVLALANIVDWTVTVTENGDTFTLTGPLSGNNSTKFLMGSVLFGSLVDLVFDFSTSGGFGMQFGTIGSGLQFYCAQGAQFPCFDSSGGPGEGIAADPNFEFERNSLSGRVVIATAAAAPVPEPATMGLLGLGLAGIAIAVRRKRAA